MQNIDIGINFRIINQLIIIIVNIFNIHNDEIKKECDFKFSTQKHASPSNKTMSNPNSPQVNKRRDRANSMFNISDPLIDSESDEPNVGFHRFDEQGRLIENQNSQQSFDAGNIINLFEMSMI